MIECQLHCLVRLRFLLKPSTNRQRNMNVRFEFLAGFEAVLCEARPQVAKAVGHSKMCRGSNVKDMLVRAFQLESLILAQNERWRQA